MRGRFREGNIQRGDYSERGRFREGKIQRGEYSERGIFRMEYSEWKIQRGED